MSAVGDARKRIESQHQAHPDPAVRELIAKARAETFEDCARAALNATGANSDYDDACDDLASKFTASANAIRGAR